MKIVVDVVNSEKIAALTKEIKDQQQEILKWNKAMATATPQAQGLYQGAMEVAGKKIAAATTEIKSLQQASHGAGLGLSQLAYAVDDVQYGFNAIVNNIPQIVLGLGGSAGLAGAICIAAVAINQLIKHWSEVTALFETAWTGGSYDQLVTLKERAEAAAKAYDDLSKAKSHWDEQAGKKSGEAIADAGTDKVRKQIADALLAGGHVTPQKARAGMKTQLMGNGMSEKDADAAIREWEKNLTQKQSVKDAEQLMGGLSQGGDQARAAFDMIKRLIKEGSISAELGDKLLAADPERIKEKEKEEADQKAADKQKQEDDKNRAAHEHMMKEEADAERKKLEDAKRARIQSLEDEREVIQKNQRDFDDKMFERRQEAGQHGQIMQGARAASDYYQTAGRGDGAKELAKQAHEQRKKTNEQLDAIRKAVEKERRLVVPH